MKLDRSTIKQQMREHLRGKWLRAFGVVILISLVSSCVSLVTAPITAALNLALESQDMSKVAALSALQVPLNFLSLAVTICVSLPLAVSLNGYFVLLSRGGSPTLRDAFSGFRNYGVNIGSMLWMELWLLIWSLPMVALIIVSAISVAIAAVASGGFMTGLAFAGIGAVICLVLALCAAILPAIKSYSYRLIPFIIWETPQVGALKAMNLSKKITKGHKWELFVLDLSFILWYLGLILVMFIVAFAGGLIASFLEGTAFVVLGTVLLMLALFGLILVFCSYLVPYISTTQAAYYDRLKALAITSGLLNMEDFDDNKPLPR
jgi:uncharacterized membrane protein